jgi:hypothetical protein
MIAIIAVRPNVILGRQDLSSPQIKSYVFLFWDNMTSYGKNYSISLAFELRSKEICAKAKKQIEQLMMKNDITNPAV